MESTNRQQELLRMYVERTLSGDDLAEFRHLAQTDPVFRREAELERRISQALEKAREEKLRRQLNRIHDEVTAQVTQSTGHGRVIQVFGRSVPMQWAAAAAIILLLGIGTLVWTITRLDQAGQMANGKRYTIPQDEITMSFGMAGSDTVKTTTEIPVVIYANTTNQMQYSFQADTLRLFGTFRTNELRLIVNRPSNAPETYRLQIGENSYELNRQATEPTSLTK